ncbi:MAG: 1-acyl-sn-glycerol-3-phosphate acyltransferase [Nitrosomonadales bacterium]|nr:1-acyl-sn-glycerol-3-phosphate acyltransferase [Nitrosomonadales bacterium]
MRTTKHHQNKNVLVACLRGMWVACHIIYGMLLAGFYPALNAPTQRCILKHWSHGLLNILRVGLETHGSHFHHGAGQGRLFVANHISWLDAVALNAAAPACFVAKAELADWPLLGWMCRRTGTLFIRRDLRRDAAHINERITAALQQEKCIAVFPEGTTTDGTHPGHFHSSLLQGALDAGAAIQPVAIRYHDGSGEHNGDAAYVGDMTFIQSLWKILCSPCLHATLVYLPHLPQAGKSRRILAAQAQGAVHTALSMLSTEHAVHVPEGIPVAPGKFFTTAPAAKSLI